MGDGEVPHAGHGARQAGGAHRPADPRVGAQLPVGRGRNDGAHARGPGRARSGLAVHRPPLEPARGSGSRLVPALDLWPVLETLKIKTKNATIKRLNRSDKFAWAQRELVAEVERQYNAGLPVRIIVLKGRQVGLSTVTEGILFLWSFLHPGSAALVLSKKQDDSDYLFSMFKRYWEEGPFYGLFPEKFNRIGYMEWGGTGSSVTTSTAKDA